MMCRAWRRLRRVRSSSRSSRRRRKSRGTRLNVRALRAPLYRWSVNLRLWRWSWSHWRLWWRIRCSRCNRRDSRLILDRNLPL